VPITQGKKNRIEVIYNAPRDYIARTMDMDMGVRIQLGLQSLEP
jgi:hypothetical protein